MGRLTLNNKQGFVALVVILLAAVIAVLVVAFIRVTNAN
jgi:hypothetical protein